MAAQFGNSADIIGRLLDALKTKKGVVDVSKIVDADNNNPVHLFVLGTSNHTRNRDEEDSEMLILLLDAGTPQQRGAYRGSTETDRAYALLTIFQGWKLGHQQCEHCAATKACTTATY